MIHKIYLVRCLTTVQRGFETHGRRYYVTISILYIFNRDVLVLLTFSHFLPERVKTGSLGTTESEV